MNLMSSGSTWGVLEGYSKVLIHWGLNAAGRQAADLEVFVPRTEPEMGAGWDGFGSVDFEQLVDGRLLVLCLTRFGLDLSRDDRPIGSTDSGSE